MYNNSDNIDNNINGPHKTDNTTGISNEPIKSKGIKCLRDKELNCLV